MAFVAIRKTVGKILLAVSLVAIAAWFVGFGQTGSKDLIAIAGFFMLGVAMILLAPAPQKTAPVVKAPPGAMNAGGGFLFFSFFLTVLSFLEVVSIAGFQWYIRGGAFVLFFVGAILVGKGSKPSPPNTP